MDILYTAEATAWGGREGRVASSDGVVDVQLAIPKEMGGPGGDKTNPEQLFAAGYAACFHSALKLIAARDKIDVSESAITAKVGFGNNGQGGFALEVALEAELPGLDAEEARALVAKAHEVCPYSNATRNNIEVAVAVV
ncbi:MAG: organic hydroperoxide resistance protein [Acidimicrobiales bacterium]